MTKWMIVFSHNLNIFDILVQNNQKIEATRRHSDAWIMFSDMFSVLIEMRIFSDKMWQSYDAIDDALYTRYSDELIHIDSLDLSLHEQDV